MGTMSEARAGWRDEGARRGAEGRRARASSTVVDRPRLASARRPARRRESCAIGEILIWRRPDQGRGGSDGGAGGGGEGGSLEPGGQGGEQWAATNGDRPSRSEFSWPLTGAVSLCPLLCSRKAVGCFSHLTFSASGQAPGCHIPPTDGSNSRLESFLLRPPFSPPLLPPTPARTMAHRHPRPAPPHSPRAQPTPPPAPHFHARRLSDPLAAALQPPPDETPAQREERVKAEEEAKRRSETIDRMIRHDERSRQIGRAHV